VRRLGLLIALQSLGFGCNGADETSEATPRNSGISVLLITIDTLRPDHMSTYGYPRPTSPHIDTLASKGVVFDLAFTYWPKTRGSFAAMFTGLYASQHGLTVRDRDLPDFNATLAETFQKAGYRTAAAVDNGNLDASLGYAQGFEAYEQTFLRDGTDEVERTETITGFGEEFLARRGEGPFFLWLHYVNPHTPYTPPEEYLSRFRGDGVIPRGGEIPKVVGFHGGVNRQTAVEGARTWGDYVDRYDAEILLADEHVGRVLKALESSSYASSTLVVLTSDHGESLGEHDYYVDHGDDLFNPSLRIPGNARALRHVPGPRGERRPLSGLPGSHSSARGGALELSHPNGGLAAGHDEKTPGRRGDTRRGAFRSHPAKPRGPGLYRSAPGREEAELALRLPLRRSR
jgi:arylsulfatase A-like enzyme